MIGLLFGSGTGIIFGCPIELTLGWISRGMPMRLPPFCRLKGSAERGVRNA